MRLDLVLPPTSFVSFSASKLSAPSVVWTNLSLSPELDVERYGYAIPLPGDPESAYLPVEKEFYGERYGGTGVYSNGGGVRCGLDGEVQVKGIGRNPLVGRTADFFHSYGGASLAEAIVEAVWGELCNLALPFGAVRVHGLVLTGTRVPMMAPRAGQETTMPRALILREAVVRPAHYMRSVFYQPTDAMKSSPSDVDRTRLAVQSISQTLRGLVGEEGSAPLKTASINAALTEMFCRFAAQIAAGRAKRIMHGALTDSNLSMDGQWLDYATVSAMGDYGNIYTCGDSSFLHDERSLLGLCADLLFYVGKYFCLSDEVALIGPGELWGRFNQYFHARLEVEFLKLTGISESQLRGLDPDICHDLYQCMVAIMRAGTGNKFMMITYDPEIIQRMPLKTGHFHLNTILSTIALCASAQQALAELADLLCAEELRARLVRSYFALRERYLDQYGTASERAHAEMFNAVNMLRVNMSLPHLYRPHLYGAIFELIAASGNVSRFIEKTIDTAKVILAEPVAGVVDISAWTGVPATLCEREGFVIEGRRRTVAEALALIEESAILPAQRDALLRRFATSAV